MADDVDRASEGYDFLFDHQIKLHQAKMARPSNKYCEECDCEIPERRRKATGGITHCVDCQEHIERRR